MCDTLVVVRPGKILFAKNSDRDPNEAQFPEWHSRKAYPAGATLRCTHIEIPQARETHAVLLSRPFWIWGAEIGSNEHGLTIGNEAVFTRQPYAKTGLLGMDLLRLALERARNTDEAIQVITSLLEQYGQGGGAGHEDRNFTYHNSFILADPQGAVVLETAGKFYATEKVQGARSISNGLTIPGFAEQHSDWLKTTVSACRIRQPRTQVLASQAQSLADLMRLLRDHGPSGPQPQYSPLNGGLSAPCVHAGGLAAASQTTASWVAELTPHGCSHWVTATSAPCTGIFKTVSVNEPLDLGLSPTDNYDPTSLWWRHERLHRLALQDPDNLLPLYAEQRDNQEAAWLNLPPSPQAAFAQADQLLEQWTALLRQASAVDLRPWYVRRYWQKRNQRAGLS